MRLLFLLIGALTLSSCAGVVNVAPQVNGLAVAGRYDQALKVLDDPQKYGTNNQLLFLLDKGLVLHLSGEYEESIAVFEEAKLKYEQLYTQSISKGALSWLWNDYALPYRGEDFERVTINIFQALNFVALGKVEEALVEARDVDSTLNAINSQYAADQKNVYRQDAFARLLMGILYEADGNLNDALISYRMSWLAYAGDYKKQYNVEVPQILKENLLAAAQKFGDRDLADYQKAFPSLSYESWDEKQSKAQVFVVEYQGQAPIKLPVEIPIPMPDGYISQIAFPHYEKRTGNLIATAINATATDDGSVYYEKSQLGQDIAAIAVKNLNDRKVRIIAKAILRTTGKYVAEKAIEKQIARKNGEGSASAVRLIGSLFNMFSEKADLRSWLTLPAQIRLGHLILEPGEYDITVGNQDLGHVTLEAGDKKFFIVRTLP